MTLRIVEQRAGETIVELRPGGGLGRWFEALIDLAKLGAWALGLALIGNTLLGSTAIGWRLPMPAALAEILARESMVPSPPIAALLALFLLAWFVAGLATLRGLLRSLFGRDRVILGPDGFQSFRGLAFLGRERSYRRGEVEWIALQGKNRELRIQSGGRVRLLTDLGDDADRRWLVDQLKERYGLRAPPDRILQSSRTAKRLH